MGKRFLGKRKKKFLWGKFLLRSCVNCSCFFSLLSLILPPCAILKSLAPSLWPSCRQWKKLLGPLKAIPSPGGRSPSPSSFPPRIYVPALNHSGSSWCCWLFHVSCFLSSCKKSRKWHAPLYLFEQVSPLLRYSFPSCQIKSCLRVFVSFQWLILASHSIWNINPFRIWVKLKEEKIILKVKTQQNFRYNTCEKS